MKNKEVLKKRLEIKKAALENYYEAWKEIIKGGVKSYAIGSRNLTKHDLPQIEESIKKLEQEVDALQAQLNGGGRRKTVSIVPRDW